MAGIDAAVKNITIDENELIIELAKMNWLYKTKVKNLNNENDERDSIIERILWDADFQKCYWKKVYEFEQYYKNKYGDRDFEGVVHKVLVQILKAFTFKDKNGNDKNIKNPKGWLISHCFKKRTYQKGALVQDYVDSYFNSVKNDIPELRELLLFDAQKQKEYNDLEEPEEIEPNYEDEKYEVEQYEPEYYFAETSIDDMNSIDDKIILTKYSSSYDSFRYKYFWKTNQEIMLRYEKSRTKKLKKWRIYKNKTQHTIYHQIPKKLNFDNIFNDILPDEYIKKIILNNLSKRQALIVGLYYYEMKKPEYIIDILQFKDLTALNKELSRIKKKLKLVLLKDYQYIQEQFPETYLDYWVRKIRDKFEKKLLKKCENM
jgi:hypothetical protein